MIMNRLSDIRCTAAFPLSIRAPGTRYLLPIIPLLLPFFFCSPHTHPVEPVISGRTATIYEPDGESGAAGTVVKVFDAGSRDDRAAAVYITDDEGGFSIDSLPTGIYSIWAGKDSLVLFQESVLVATNQTTLHDDTLECPSSLDGIVSIKPDHDARTVTVRIIGAGRAFAVTDIKGRFTLQGLAGGNHLLLLTSTVPDYTPTIRAITLDPCSHDTVSDTLRLDATGIPAIADMQIIQDTVVGTMTLSWKKTRHKDFLDYLLYREECAAKDFEHKPFLATGDTFFVDSFYVHLPADLADTAGRCIRYWIVVRTNGPEIGPAYRNIEWQFAPKSYIMTAPRHHVENAEKPECDSASINDTVLIAETVKNRTRPLRSIIWYDPVTDDSISKATNPDTLAREFTDTIRYSFGTVGIHRLYAIAIDNAGARTIDTVPVKIVADIPRAIAGNDTGVFTGEKAYLHGKARQQFGRIVTWKWKIGSDEWQTTSGPDTVVTMPAAEQPVTCILSVTDEDDNSTTDEMTVFTSLKVTSVAAGAAHSLIIKSDGTAWACGASNEGQLGYWAYRTASFVKVFDDVQEIAAGGNHSLFLKTDGSLWACGNNSFGQLGNGTTASQITPVKVADGVRHMAAGARHSMILFTAGNLFTCGANDSGQLGDGTDTNRLTPVEVMTDVNAVAAGSRHSLMLKTDGTLWACGKNHSGQLGDETEDDKRTPVQVYGAVETMSAGDRHSLVVKNDGSVWSSGNNWFGQLGDSTGGRRLKPEQVMTNVQSVAAGTGFSHFIKLDGTLWVSGSNETGQIGAGTADTVSRPVLLMDNVQITVAGERHSLILKTDGSLWVCGDNSDGQLGDGTEIPHITPIRIIPYLVNEEGGAQQE